MKKLLGGAFAATFAALSFSPSAFASCIMSDLVGTWTVYFFGAASVPVTSLYYSCSIPSTSSSMTTCGSDLNSLQLVDADSCHYSFTKNISGQNYKFNVTLNQNANFMGGVSDYIQNMTTYQTMSIRTQ